MSLPLFKNSVCQSHLWESMHRYRIYLGHWGQLSCSGAPPGPIKPSFFGDLPVFFLFLRSPTFLLYSTVYSHFCCTAMLLQSHFKFLERTNCLLSVL